MPEITDLSLVQIIDALRNGELNSRALTEAYLERIHRYNPSYNIFLNVAEEALLEAADSADRKYMEWRKEPNTPIPSLLGVPVAVKDVICVAGMPCTCGSYILENFIPPYNATAVERLLEAGALVLGKTNTDEFAMGSSTENSAFGPTHNPWNYERVPGGSSGGSAAAVAAGMAPLALGTDTGGSVRQPASFTGVSAIKPTYGRVSRYGLVAFGSSLDVIGAFSGSVEDLVLGYCVIAGADPHDATTLNLPVEQPILQNGQEKPLAGLRIGVPDEYFIPGMQSCVEKAVREAVQMFESLGAQSQPIHLPHTRYALPVYYLIAPAEASANLARYDGIRYGARVPSDVLWDVVRETRGQKFGSEVKRRIMLGTYALSAGYYDAFYGQAQKVRTLIRQDFDQAFKEVDLIAAPVTPNTAFKIGEHADDPLSMYLEDIFTLPANLAGIPGLAFPVGQDSEGLPISMQLMAGHFREDLLFQAGYAYQQATTWHRLKPILNEKGEN